MRTSALLRSNTAPNASPARAERSIAAVWSQGPLSIKASMLAYYKKRIAERSRPEHENYFNAQQIGSPGGS